VEFLLHVARRGSVTHHAHMASGLLWPHGVKPPGRFLRALLAGSLVAAIAGCGSSGSGSGFPSEGGTNPCVGCPTTPADGAYESNVPIDDGGPLSCGSETCGANQYCVHPTCGGGVGTSCTPTPDGGCPAGWRFSATCPIAQHLGPGCVPPPCTPPPGFCNDLHGACSAGLSCSCLPSNVCDGDGSAYGGSCGSVQGRDVSCVSGG
jgi:hypothetical protein